MVDASKLRGWVYGQHFDDVGTRLEFDGTLIWELTESNPTDEGCEFCDEPKDKRNLSAFDLAAPLAGGRVALKPNLGMIRPGYMLGVTREHTTSFAQFSREALAEIDVAFTGVESRLKASLGHDSYIRLEHGSDTIKDCGLGAGGCIVHAHQHLIPGTERTADRMLTQDLGWQALEAYEGLAELKGHPYLYVGHNGRHHVAVDPEVRGQWGRRIVATEDGHDDWDWAVFSGAINLVQTFLALGSFPPGQLIAGYDSEARYIPRKHPRGESSYR